ncbi:MAG: Fur family transcriptional regulator [Candidatus Caldatribacteriaceae bacterium]
MNHEVSYLKEYLKRHQVKSSTIRILVLDYLLEKRIHPTAEDLYRALLGKLPTVSLASVYNTLELFLKKGIVKTVPTQKREARYDIDHSFHGHFECQSCGKMYDFKLDPSNIDLGPLEGFEVKNREIYCQGFCPQCLQENKNS